jgi:hypothetical protein
LDKRLPDRRPRQRTDDRSDYEKKRKQGKDEEKRNLRGDACAFIAIRSFVHSEQNRPHTVCSRYNPDKRCSISLRETLHNSQQLHRAR